MSKRILIDAAHSEEIRVAILDNGRLEDFDLESNVKKQVKGNIYLAKVIRVEPSLQAAFVDYGTGKHGFLPFAEIHPDYYQIPVADRKALMDRALKAANHNFTPGEDLEDDDIAVAPRSNKRRKGPNFEDADDLGSDDDYHEAIKQQFYEELKKYKIQEVIKNRQIVLVQVIKEERGNKGATLSTYISMPGRFCVLMPNNIKGSGSGVSRKINNSETRRRLKNILKDINTEENFNLIVRTAGADKSASEIKQDYEYLRSTWVEIKDKTLASNAPCLIHEEGDLISRTMRDLDRSDIDEIIIDGEIFYKNACNYAKALGNATKKIKLFEGDIPIFHKFGIEEQIETMYYPEVKLRSGGAIVINPTEALVSIDVNSGRATKERNIEETALKTNLEAAEEICRQLKLRDLAGLVVVDFIDMEDSKNNMTLEHRMRELLRFDRSRIQVAKLSPFGLMEISRQRLRPSVIETNHKVCPHCKGTGYVRSTASVAILMIRMMEEELYSKSSPRVIFNVPEDVAIYMLNHKRKDIRDLEVRYTTSIIVNADAGILNYADYVVERFTQNEKDFTREEDNAIKKNKMQKENEDVLKNSKTSSSRKFAPQKKWWQF
jgi:ribonuclease E